MKRLTAKLFLAGILVWPSVSYADVTFNNGVWTTSFDYGQECSMGGSDPLNTTNCDLVSDDSINWSGGTLHQGGNYSSAVVAAKARVVAPGLLYLQSTKLAVIPCGQTLLSLS